MQTGVQALAVDAFRHSSVLSGTTQLQRGKRVRATRVQCKPSGTVYFLSLSLKCRIYKTLVRIGSGLSLEDYEWVNMKPWKPLNKYKPPYWLRVSETGSEDKGDVYLDPEECVLITYLQLLYPRAPP